jgi:hypothetical protein
VARAAPGARIRLRALKDEGFCSLLRSPELTRSLPQTPGKSFRRAAGDLPRWSARESRAAFRIWIVVFAAESCTTLLPSEIPRR